MTVCVLATSLETARDFVVPTAAVLATIAGVWLANSYRRQMTLKLAETRRMAYARLWEITGVAAPIRLDEWGDEGFLRPDERARLWHAMTVWYYSNGDGMMLGDVTKTVYLNVKHNLVCETGQLKPQGLDAAIAKELGDVAIDPVIRGNLSIAQISLLRTQLKSDLKIYGQTFSPSLAPHETYFLENSEVDLRSEPWASATGLRRFGRSQKPKGVQTKPTPRPLHGVGPTMEHAIESRTPDSSRTALWNEFSHLITTETEPRDTTDLGS